jgi:hypothetical protein
MYINPRWMSTMMLLAVIVIITSSCTEMAFIGGATTIGISQNPYAKAYSGIDVLTIMSTEKDIKSHVYEELKGNNEHK